jgi:hypothetical protein
MYSIKCLYTDCTSVDNVYVDGDVIIGEYSPRRSRGEYSPIIREPEANNCFSNFTQVFCVFFGTDFI